MIKLKRDGSGLAKYAKRMSYIDTDPTSKNYFRLLDFPQRLYVGKNVFRIFGNANHLVKGSRIYIDIVDANGGYVYYEVLSSTDADGSKIITIWIYDDTPPGMCTVYIGGRTTTVVGTGVNIAYNMDASDELFYIHVPNILWVGQCLISPDVENKKDIVYLTEPVVEYTEKLVPVYTTTDYNRRVQYTSSMSDQISTATPQAPGEYSPISSLYSEPPKMSADYINPLPTINSNSGESTSPVYIPPDGQLSVVRSTQEIFTKDMVGGTLLVYNISSSIISAGDVPAEQRNIRLSDYSASIVNVINSRVVEVAPPYLQTFEYVSTTTGTSTTSPIKSFINHPKFTITYTRSDINMSSSSRHDSYMSVHIKNLEPLAGSVSKIGLQYKSIGEFGDFNDVGVFDIPDQNFLVDRNAYTLTKDSGIQPIKYGSITSSDILRIYWTTGSSATVTGSFNFTKADTYLRDSMYITSSHAFALSDYLLVQPRRPNTDATTGTEYVLTMGAVNFEKRSDWAGALMEIYISGSSIYTGENSKILSNESPLMNPEFGEYIGSIHHTNGKRGDYEFSFLITDGSHIVPKFIVRSGDWAVNDINLKPRKTRGYTPNQVNLDIPLQDVWSKSELMFKFSYYNDNGAMSETTSTLYGVVFTGSNKSALGGGSESTASAYTNITAMSLKIQTGSSQIYNTGTYDVPQAVLWDVGSAVFNGEYSRVDVLSSSYVALTAGIYLIDWHMAFGGTATALTLALLERSDINWQVVSSSIYSGPYQSTHPATFTHRYAATSSIQVGLGILSDGSLYIPSPTASLKVSYFNIRLIST